MAFPRTAIRFTAEAARHSPIENRRAALLRKSRRRATHSIPLNKKPGRWKFFKRPANLRFGGSRNIGAYGSSIFRAEALGIPNSIRYFATVRREISIPSAFI